MIGCDYMRYIGSKNNLLEKIENVINENILDNSNTFMDLFSGTGIVSEYFKKNIPLFQMIYYIFHIYFKNQK